MSDGVTVPAIAMRTARRGGVQAAPARRRGPVGRATDGVAPNRRGGLRVRNCADANRVPCSAWGERLVTPPCTSTNKEAAQMMLEGGGGGGMAGGVGGPYRRD